MDNGTEYSELQKHCETHSIVVENSGRDSPIENAVAERKNRTLQFMMKTSLSSPVVSLIDGGAKLYDGLLTQLIECLSELMFKTNLPFNFCSNDLLQLNI